MEYLYILFAIVGAALIAGATAIYFLRARFRETAGSQPSNLASGAAPVAVAEEVKAIGDQIERALSEQRLQGETQRQLLAQKLDGVRQSVEAQRTHVDGLRSEMRHEAQRRDVEMDEIRSQIGAIQQVAALPGTAPLALGTGGGPSPAAPSRAPSGPPASGTPTAFTPAPGHVASDPAPVESPAEPPASEPAPFDSAPFASAEPASFEPTFSEPTAFDASPETSAPFDDPAGSDPAPSDAPPAPDTFVDAFAEVSFSQGSFPQGSFDPAAFVSSASSGGDSAAAPIEPPAAPDPFANGSPIEVDAWTPTFEETPFGTPDFQTPTFEETAFEETDLGGADFDEPDFDEPDFEEVVFGESAHVPAPPAKPPSFGVGATGRTFEEVSFGASAPPAPADPPQTIAAPAPAAPLAPAASPEFVSDEAFETVGFESERFDEMSFISGQIETVAPAAAAEPASFEPISFSSPASSSPAVTTPASPTSAPERTGAAEIDPSWIARPDRPVVADPTDIPAPASTDDFFSFSPPDAPDASEGQDGLIDMDALAVATGEAVTAPAAPHPPEPSEPMLPAAPPSPMKAEPAPQAAPTPPAGPPVAEAEPEAPAYVAPEGAEDLTVITSIDDDLQRLLYLEGVTKLEDIAQWGRSRARQIAVAVRISEETIMNQWVIEAQAAMFDQFSRQAGV